MHGEGMGNLGTTDKIQGKRDRWTKRKDPGLHVGMTGCKRQQRHFCGWA
jgi:hypothetical protein